METTAAPFISTEKRAFQSKVEVRKEGETTQIVGKILINTLSVDMGGWKEEIMPGAFDSILDNDIRGLKNHNENLILGRTKSGTMRIAVDEAGNLGYEIDPPNTTYSNDLIESISRGDIDGTSFQFTLSPDGREWIDKGNGEIVRRITKFLRMIDISPVTFPAYPAMPVSARSEFDEFKKTLEKKEEKQESKINLNRCKRRERLIEIDN